MWQKKPLDMERFVFSKEEGRYIQGYLTVFTDIYGYDMYGNDHDFFRLNSIHWLFGV